MAAWSYNVNEFTVCYIPKLKAVLLPQPKQEKQKSEEAIYRENVML